MAMVKGNDNFTAHRSALPAPLRGRNDEGHRRSGVLHRLAALQSDDSGVALVFTIAAFLFLFVLVLSIYSIGEAIRQKEEVQNACDAAAHAGAVAQADDISRIAVLNRALSWNYVQMTKLQMDYITYSWLRVTCDNFAEDKERCLKHDSPWGILSPSRNSGWTFVPDLLGGVCQEPETTFLFTDWWKDWWGDPIWPRKWIVLNCKHNIHNEDNRISHYIGMRSGNDTKEEEVRINGYDLDDRCLRFKGGSRSGAPYGGDFDLVDGGKVVQTSILAEIENLYGGYGCPKLKEQINGCKGRAAAYFSFIEAINKSMKDHITAAVRETLMQNLPRGGEEDPDDDTLSDYYWFCTGGTSVGPREYQPADESGGGESKSYVSFWSGLRNTEQDEMVFLNMADGLPEGAQVTLADYFKDEYSSPLEGGGLDQWFIRCRPEESKFDGASNETGVAGGGAGGGGVGSKCGGDPGVCIERDWASPTPGIVRCYKNANYHDARSQTIPEDIHRGNYLFDGLDNALDFISKAFGEGVGSIFKGIPLLGGYLGGLVGDFTSKMIGSLLSGIRNLVGTNIVAPSCHNVRTSFPDTCAAIPESWGLVAEYEWAAAYWICWYEEEGWWPVGSVTQCWHLPLPIGAAFGGATDNGYDPGGFLGFATEVLKNFSKKSGHSRSKYRTEGIFLDGERWNVAGCDKEPLQNGLGANTGLKSYVRVYGDDRRAYDENYCGAPSMPWLLNENFFNGGGTIIVGLARKRRNVFDLLVGERISPKSLYAAFSPPDGSHMVALAAARAAYAPRHGDQSADGEDTVNAEGGTRYDIHYDASCKNLGPKLIRGDDHDADWEQKASQLESAPFWIGCVCTDDSGNNSSSEKMSRTANRLRRQWNLCQTDWDGVLLPLRFTRAAITEFNSNPSGQAAAPAENDDRPEWVESKSDYRDDDSIWELVQLLMKKLAESDDDTLYWRSLGSGGKTSLDKLLDPQSPSDEKSLTEAFRRRRVL